MLGGTLIGMVVIPWTIILWGCPNAFECLANVPTADLVRSNAFAVAWGISTVLSCFCYVRIGIGLTIALLVGLAIPVGTLTTLVFKGSGLFQDAPALGSHAGLAILASVLLMIVGVVLTALAGFGREQQQKKIRPAAGSFTGGLVMMVISGLLVGCMNFSFVYSQDSILGNLSLIRPGDSIAVTLAADNAERINGTFAVDAEGAVSLPRLGRLPLNGASAWDAARQIERRYAATQAAQSVRAHVETGSISAAFGACVVPLLGGTAVSCVCAVFLLFRNRSWRSFVCGGWDPALLILMGTTGALSIFLWGKGTLMLGAIGASIGWGISQATKVIGSTGLAYVSGEWHGVRGKPLMQMRLAVAILVVAALIMAYGKALAGR
jgi:hypothetical protein